MLSPPAFAAPGLLFRSTRLPKLPVSSLLMRFASSFTCHRPFTSQLKEGLPRFFRAVQGLQGLFVILQQLAINMNQDEKTSMTAPSRRPWSPKSL